MQHRSIALVLLVAATALAWTLLRLPGRPGEEAPVALAPTAQPSATASPSATPYRPEGVFAFGVPDGQGEAIALVDAAGGAPRLLAAGFDAVEGPAFSPEGSRVAFGGLKDANWDVYVVATDGGPVRRVTHHAAYDGEPAWSPDGSNLAFSSYRDQDLEVYVTSLAGGEPVRVTDRAGPDRESAWDPASDRVIVSSWQDGRYVLAAYSLVGGPAQTVATAHADWELVDPRVGADGTLVALQRRHGEAQLVTFDLEVPTARPLTLAASAEAADLAPDGDAAVAFVSGGRLEARHLETRASAHVAELPPGAKGLAWGPGALPEHLPELSAAPLRRQSGGFAGLTRLDVSTSGPRIHAGLAADFAALRAEVEAATGRDFLGRLSDLWRPLDFYSTGSAYFSWHKVGRAFDTVMDWNGPGGRRDLVLVREDRRGRPYWRMYLRAAAQDGTIGRPLTEPGWTFSAGGGSGPESEGGLRGSGVPAGYFVDFTAMAARYGWTRIPGIRQANFDWRRDWAAIEYWHFERRDGLSWFAAAREVYSEDELAGALSHERLRQLGIPASRLTRAGVPRDWAPGG